MTRRTLLASIGLAPLAAPAAARREHTVAGLEIFRVKVNRRGDWLLARIRTENGLTGIGEASQARDEAAIAVMRGLFEKLKGRSIFDIEWLRSEAQPRIAAEGMPAAVALSAIEQSLWDLVGKATGVPCWQLFGGKLRDRIRAYANINRSTDPRTPAGFGAMAEKAVAAGFDAIKLAPFDEMPHGLKDEAEIERYMKLGIECAAAVRRAIGPKRDLLVDVHSHMDLRHGLELARRMEPLDLFWIEEVTPARPLSDLAAINRAAKMRTAGGESIYGVKGFYPYIAGGAVDVAMPDVKYCGGMLELKKIAALAEGAGILVSPHSPAGPVGGVAAAHVCAGLPNFLILELAYGEVPWRAELIDPPEPLENGRIVLTDRPGLGIALNERTVAKYRII